MNYRNILMLGVAFAAAGGAAGAAKPAGSPAPAADASAKNKVEIIGISSAVTMPQNVSKRGSKPKYDYEKLEVGQSIAIKGRTAESLNSTISGWNRNAKVQKTDENGKKLFEQKEIKDQTGAVTAVVDDKERPIMLPGKHYFATNCDPKTDPEGASCRIWRDA